MAETHTGSDSRGQRGSGPTPSLHSADLTTGLKAPLDSGINLGFVGELHTLALHLRASSAEINEGSQVILTVGEKRDVLTAFDAAGDRFGALLDGLVPNRAEDRVEYADVTTPQPIDHVFTNYDVTIYFKSISSVAAQKEFKAKGRVEFDYGGTTDGTRWTISLTNDSGKLSMKWTFAYEKS